MAEPTLIERLTELANQLGGHAGPSDTVELSEFLTKCEKEAFAIATELHRLERHSLPSGAAGYRLVPEEPTEAMRDAFYSAWIFTKEQMPLVPAYRAMLAASPPPSVAKDKQ